MAARHGEAFTRPKPDLPGQEVVNESAENAVTLVRAICCAL